MKSEKYDEIDLLSIFKRIWKQKLTIFLISFSFTLIGIVTALTTPFSYSASTIFIPQIQQKNNTTS